MPSVWESTLGIGEIVGRIGYDSEAAINRAFRPLVGSPTVAWRQTKNIPVHAGEKTAN
jgi:AraC family transcriptional regulator, alkane utilization regulator